MAISWLARGWSRWRDFWDPAAPPLETKGYFVLGMHRSGTSCLTGVLETAGLWLGEVSRQNVHNKKGNLEDKAIQAVNNAILEQFGGSWRRPPESMDWKKVDPRPLVRALAPYRARDHWVVKDPRMVLTLEAWLAHVPRRQFIGTFRHPVAVARSLHKRSGMAMDEGLSLWAAYNRRLVQLHEQQVFPLVCFDLRDEAYLEQCRRVCPMIGLRFDRRAAAEFYARQLISQGCDESVALKDEVSEIYRYLMEHQVPAARETQAATRLAG